MIMHLSQLISQDLKSNIDRIIALKQSSPDSTEEIKKIYLHDILPILIQLRYQNRLEKDSLDKNVKKIQEFNARLFEIKEIYDGLSFMTSCLAADLGNSGDVQELSSEDHLLRLNKLDEEEAERKNLQLKLAELNESYKKIEALSYHGADKLNRVKPYIEQLLMMIETIKEDDK